MASSSVLERGQIFYFYRPKVDADRPDEVQRFFLVTRSDERYRLILLGAKALPNIAPGMDPSQRGWAMVELVTKDRRQLEEALQGGSYETKTRGTRHLPPAAPVAEGSYALVQQDGEVELVQRLARDKDAALEGTFGLVPESAYVLAVKNPEVRTGPFPEAEVRYPKRLAESFRGRRWVPAADPALLDYEKAQLLLIGARDEDAAKAAGVSLRPKRTFVDDLDLDLPDAALIDGTFPELAAFHRRHQEAKSVGFGAGSGRGGEKAAQETGSASAIARLLKGVELPAGADALRHHARRHRQRLGDAGPALERLDGLPDDTYETMAEVMEALGETGGGDRVCPHCGRTFSTGPELRQHLEASHPEQAPSAADLEAALGGVRFPARREDLEAEVTDEPASLQRLVKALPDRTYRDAADVSVALHDAVSGEDTRSSEAPSSRGGAASPATAVARALSGIDLPAEPEAIQAHARGAGREVESLLAELPPGRYRDLAEIQAALGPAYEGSS